MANKKYDESIKLEFLVSASTAHVFGLDRHFLVGGLCFDDRDRIGFKNLWSKIRFGKIQKESRAKGGELVAHHGFGRTDVLLFYLRTLASLEHENLVDRVAGGCGFMDLEYLSVY